MMRCRITGSAIMRWCRAIIANLCAPMDGGIESFGIQPGSFRTSRFQIS
jgi:hypothetical protein